MSDARLPVPHPQVLFTEIDDGTGVLLHLDSKFYFTLNSTGVVVWKALAERVEGIDAIAQRLSKEFRVEPSDALRDVNTVIASLMADGLIASR
jgi:hypothetical protein